MTSGHHESVARREDVAPPSERSFGFVFAVLFLGIGLLKLWVGYPGALLWFAAAAVLAGLAQWAPGILAAPNRLWLRFGLVLHSIVTPVTLFLLWAVVFTPMGLILRLVRRQGRGRGLPAESYWIERPAHGRGTMRNQF